MLQYTCQQHKYTTSWITEEVPKVKNFVLVFMVLLLVAPAAVLGGTDRTVIAELATGTW